MKDIGAYEMDNKHRIVIELGENYIRRSEDIDYTIEEFFKMLNRQYNCVYSVLKQTSYKLYKGESYD